MKEKMLSSFPNEKYDGFLEFVEAYNLSGDEVARLFIEWHGTDILSRDFIDELEDEGYYL